MRTRFWEVQRKKQDLYRSRSERPPISRLRKKLITNWRKLQTSRACGSSQLFFSDDVRKFEIYMTNSSWGLWFVSILDNKRFKISSFFFGVFPLLDLILFVGRALAGFSFCFNSDTKGFPRHEVWDNDDTKISGTTSVKRLRNRSRWHNIWEFRFQNHAS